MIMKPNLAGSFYTSDPEKLREQINNFLLKTELEKDYTDSLGIISPHAGYIYSGQCAAYGYRALKIKDFELAVIMAPCHRYIGFEYSVGDFTAYRTPLGDANVAVDEVISLLSERKFQFIKKAYDNENSLETQIPFLQVVKPDARILPILVGNQCRNNSRHLAETLLKQFEGRLDRVVFIASSDLSHYHTAAQAAEKDSRIAENIKNRDVVSLLDNIESRKSEACGYGPILTLLYMSLMTDYDRVDNLNYSHSGLINRDNNQVVGYLSSIVYKE
jgi:AmmeMemoRadiSam system protein B